MNIIIEHCFFNHILMNSGRVIQTSTHISAYYDYVPDETVESYKIRNVMCFYIFI